MSEDRQVQVSRNASSFSNSKVRFKKNDAKNKNTRQISVSQCYNYGINGHQSYKCFSKERGFRYFPCNADVCPEKKKSSHALVKINSFR